MKKSGEVLIQAPGDYEATLQQSLVLFADAIRDALATSKNEWPDDREVTITLDFQIVPKVSCKITKL